jgi:PAS domain S-box-containing protein
MLPLTVPDATTTGHPHSSLARSRVAHASRRPSHTGHTEFPYPPIDAGPLFALARDALVVGDVDSGRIRLWNPAAEALLGYTSAEVVGRPMDLLMPPAVARLHHERLAHYARTGESDVLESRQPLSTPVLTRSGVEIRVEMSLAPFAVPGAERLVLLTLRDGSPEQRAAQHALDAARAESARAETAHRLDQHDALLRSNRDQVQRSIERAQRAARLLAGRVAAQDDRSARLSSLARVVEARTTAVEQALTELDDLAALQAGTLEMAAERVNLVPLLGRVVVDARARSSTHRLKLGAPQGLTTVGDKDRLVQIVEFLLGQAVRRNPRGCWIDIDLRRPLAGLARIEVRDYGRRLSDRERAQLADRPSPGRSWSLIKALIERQGGTLMFEVPAEGGLRAIVTLPTNGRRVSGPR